MTTFSKKCFENTAVHFYLCASNFENTGLQQIFSKIKS